MLRRASQVKAQFAIMQLVAQAYCDVSKDCITGCFKVINQIGLSDSLQPDKTLISKRNQLTAMRGEHKQRIMQVVEKVRTPFQEI